MVCGKCQGKLFQDRMFDLPKNYVEYFCLNCGRRYWLDLARLVWKIVNCN